MDYKILKKFLTPDDVKSLASEFNVSDDHVRKVCFQQTRNNDAILMKAIEIALSNQKRKEKLLRQQKQKLQQLKQSA